MKTTDKIALLRRAVQWLYEDDPETFVGGCGDVCDVLRLLAEDLGLDGVCMTGGTTPQTGWHAWLTIDGERYDPIADVLGKKWGPYEEDPSVLVMVCGGVYDEDDVACLRQVVDPQPPKRRRRS